MWIVILDRDNGRNRRKRNNKRQLKEEMYI
jgi:hypothetical protein